MYSQKPYSAGFSKKHSKCESMEIEQIYSNNMNMKKAPSEIISPSYGARPGKGRYIVHFFRFRLCDSPLNSMLLRLKKSLQKTSIQLIQIGSRFFSKGIYRTRAIITRGLYVFYPIFESQKRFFKELFL